MAKVGLTQDQKSHSIFDTDNFKMKKDQKARILLIEQEFEVEFVHWVEDVGYLVCHGDYNTVMKEGEDARCPFCKASGSSKAIANARRKFVSLIVVYRTNSKGQVLTPITFDIVPWVFGDDKFNDLLSKKEQWGDLRRHDLFIECLGEQFQKFRIDILPDAMWLKDDNVKAQVAAGYKEAKGMYAKDLRMLLGRYIDDPEKIAEIVRDATGTAAVPDYAQAGDVDAMFSDTAEGTAASTPAPSAPPPTDVDFGSLLDDTPAPQPPAPQPPAPQPQAPAPAPPKEEPKQQEIQQPVQGAPTAQVAADDVDFDDLLDA